MIINIKRTNRVSQIYGVVMERFLELMDVFKKREKERIPIFFKVLRMYI